MAAKQEDDRFPITALVPTAYQGPTTLTASERTRELIKAERWIAGESHKQQLAIREQERKTQVGQRAIGVIHESGYREFMASAESIWEERTPNGRDPKLQQELDHVATEFIRSDGGSMYAVTLEGAQRIRDEVGRSLYRETTEPKGLLAILRGETK